MNVENLIVSLRAIVASQEGFGTLQRENLKGSPAMGPDENLDALQSIEDFEKALANLWRSVTRLHCQQKSTRTRVSDSCCSSRAVVIVKSAMPTAKVNTKTKKN